MKLSRPAWWEERGIAALLCMPVSVLFHAVVWLRRLAFKVGLFKSESLSVPVVIVGNLAVGGSGKTPVVIWLVQALQSRGYKPGILSRGYGGSSRSPVEVTPTSSPEEVGDEPVLLRMRTNCPVWVGADRVQAGRALLSANPEVNIIVTDDGLQHLRLRRSAEVVVIDDRIVGNGWLMPAGPLREPLSRAGKSTVVVANGELGDRTRNACGVVPVFPMQLVPSKLYKLADPTVYRDAVSLEGGSTIAFAGIGRPERFFATLERLGLQGFDRRTFPDHYRYSADDLQTNRGLSLVMTEKDAVKCRALSLDDAWVLPVAAQIDTRMLDVLLEHLHGPQTP